MEHYTEKLASIDGVQVNAIPLYNELGANQSTVPVLFQVMAGKLRENVHRRALNIAVVLDRSGSMDGSNLNYSKKAIKELILELQADDRFHLVIYDHKVDTVIKNATPKTARDSFHKIDSIVARGTTDLYGGLARGVELLKASNRDDAEDIMFLFSDGNANVGIDDNDIIGASVKNIHTRTGIRFNAFGIGYDFNEDLMSSIARVGRGNYFFIDDIEQTPNLVKKAYTGLTNIVAEDLELKIKGCECSIISANEPHTTPHTKRWEFIREYGFYQLLVDVCVTDTVSSTVTLVEWELAIQGDMHQKGAVFVTRSDQYETPHDPNADVVVYQTMVECGKLNATAAKLLREYNHAQAIAIKEDVVKRYSDIVGIDQWGFINVLLRREKQALRTLKREGITNRSTKMCFASCSAAPGASASYTRPSYEANGDDDDQDMGFGLLLQ